MRVAVAMSGGVDSSVAALTLRDAGHEVVGLSMKLYATTPAASASDDAIAACGAAANRVPRNSIMQAAQKRPDARQSRKDASGRCTQMYAEASGGATTPQMGVFQQPAKGCCTPEDMNDARRVAATLGIAHYVLDYADAFDTAVIRPFVDEYARGRTPSPCVLCNDRLKFRTLLTRARALGCAALATGHYARVAEDHGRFKLLRARDRTKDQAYYLFGLAERELCETLFPLGELYKDAVRARARGAGLPVAEKPDSQEACFLEGRSVGEFLSTRGLAKAEGEIVDERGKTRGVHSGATRFTVGQRHGLRVADRHPLYVVSVDVAANRVVVGPRGSLAARGLVADGVRWVAGTAPEGANSLVAQVRSRHTPTPARVECTSVDVIQVWFDAPVTAVAPGQAVVVARGDEILGGGWIREALPAEERHDRDGAARARAVSE